MHPLDWMLLDSRITTLVVIVIGTEEVPP